MHNRKNEYQAAAILPVLPPEQPEKPVSVFLAVFVVCFFHPINKKQEEKRVWET